MALKLSQALAAALLVTGCGTANEPAPADEAVAAEQSEPSATGPETDTSSDVQAAQASPAVKVEEVAAAPAAKSIPIRGKGSIEEKCLKAVATEANNPGVGVNRIEESEAAIEVYVNLDGANAPWKCLAYRDGTVGEVSFTGSEGAL